MAASVTSERVELANLCNSKDWSKAIRLLDSILSRSCIIQDICNRAFCYSQLELHKHVIKDCDKALEIDPTLLQAYILKGRAFSSLGRKKDALLVWRQGHEHALCQSADLKQLLELEELLATEKEERAITSTNSTIELLEAIPLGPDKLSKTIKNCSLLTDSSEASSGLNGACETCSISNSKAKVLGKCSGNSKQNKMNDGKSDNLDCLSNRLSNMNQSCSELSDSSECKPVKICKMSNVSSKPLSIPNLLCGIYGDFDDEMKPICVSGLPNSKSISMDIQLSRGIGQVNEGKFAQAISIFNQILKESPAYPEALIGRGTSYAFQRELDAAIVDFTEAISLNPSASEAWKRRGQAQAALGKFSEAVEDLSKGLELEPDSADLLHERGVANLKLKDFEAAVWDLSMCVKLDKINISAHTFLGLAFSAIGEYEMAEEAHKKAIRIDSKYVEAWIHLSQFYYDQANSSKVLECIDEILKMDERNAKAYHLLGLLSHGLGDHRKAIKDLSMGLSIDKSNIELLYLRGSCYHAIGEYGDAVKDYAAALDVELGSVEKFVLQCLAFYQKEIALYTASKFYSEFCWFDIDGDINPLFKEFWCKRLHPKNVCEKVFRQPTLRESLRKGKHKRRNLSVEKHKATLLHAADSIGEKIQYHCPGFFPNRRQHRMAGLAAIEIAQKVSKAWRSMQAEWKCSNKNSAKFGRKARRNDKNSPTSLNRGGACCSTSCSSKISSSYGITEDRSSGRSLLSWQDVYSMAVKWRQIAEPCDPVVWINRLSEESNSGFGSHTPMMLGQAKVVRYYPNYQRTLEVAKTVMKQKAFVHDKANKVINLSSDKKINKIMSADSCSDLCRIVGDDFWLATWCNSTAFEGKQLEGTRITVLKRGECGFDFAIRTPSTPSRWEDFDVEMAMAWEAVCNAYCGEAYGSTDFNLLEHVGDAILRMTYYWYNFMPLSRGSAAVGFVVLLGLFLAANMKFTGNIPQGVQVDWVAILNFDPNSFVDSVKSWLYPSLEVTSSWKDYPDVASTLTTTRSVVTALSSYDE